MSSALAVIALTVDGTDVQVLDGIFLELRRGLNEMPSVRGKDTTVPGRTGRIRRNRKADVRTIELFGFVAGDNAGDYRDNVDAFHGLFDPTVEVELVATLENGNTATINALPLNSIWNAVNEQQAEVSVELDSVDPDWVLAGP